MGNQQGMYQINGKQFQCPIELSMSILAGRWKTTIIFRQPVVAESKERLGQKRPENVAWTYSEAQV